MPEIAAGLLAACALALIVWGLRRGESTALVGAAWFVFPLLPYLLLPEHKMDYYLAVPSIGIAILGAYAIGTGAQVRRGGRIATVLVILVVHGDFGAAVVDHDALAARTGREGGRSGARRGGNTSGGATGRSFCWMGSIATSSGAAWRICRSARNRFRACTWRRAARRAFRRRRTCSRSTCCRRRSRGARWRRTARWSTASTARCCTTRRRARARCGRDDEPRFVNIGDPVFGDYLGAGWREAVDGCRRMDGAGTIRIAAPRNSGESLYIGVFETRDFHPRVRVNGVEVAVALGQRENDLSEFRATLPPEAVQWKLMEVTIESSMQGPLLFGYAEVR